MSNCIVLHLFLLDSIILLFSLPLLIIIIIAVEVIIIATVVIIIIIIFIIIITITVSIINVCFYQPTRFIPFLSDSSPFQECVRGSQ